MLSHQPECKGWLVNKDRRKRRDRAGTLTDSDVSKLINKIEGIEEYSKLSKRNDQLLRQRDKALISLAWIFFKRAGETLRVRLGDVYFDNEELAVTFHISKKSKGVKICGECDEQNGRKGQFCKKCGASLKDTPITETGQTLTTTKRKSMEYIFCPYVTEWVENLKALNREREDYVFPPFNYFARGFLFEQHITVQRFDQILQRLDPTLTSHMFRYGATEKFLHLKYTPYDLKEIGDWSSTHMPETYAKRMGLTQSQTKFMKDTRTT